MSAFIANIANFVQLRKNSTEGSVGFVPFVDIYVLNVGIPKSFRRLDPEDPTKGKYEMVKFTFPTMLYMH